MTDLGAIALLLALAVCSYAILASLLGKRWGRPEVLDSARHAVYAVAGLLTLATLSLVYALLTRDFRIAYVAETTSRSQPFLYTIAALWGGQEGSLLFWSWLLSLMSALVVARKRRTDRPLIPYVMATLSAITFFFVLVMVSVASPFSRLDVLPQDGQGMNPLLLNPWMLVHPVALYLGFVGMSIPFAFATAALLSGKLSDAWIRTTRRWTLFAWLMLSIGVGLGAQWAYVELGWGGYWGWDPVENASFLPWLTATGFLHSVIIQERRGMLKVWNLMLIGLTFLLTVFGTFLTRSGILQSVHAFALGKVGPFFLAFLGATALGFLLLVFRRRHLLASENQLESFASREAGFLFNNLLFLGITFAIFWGSIFPLLSEAVTGDKITVGPPFFNQVAGPLFWALVVLAGIGPLLAWRRTSSESLIRNLTYPIAAAVITIISLAILGRREVYPLLGFGAVAFLAATMVSEFWRGTKARRIMTGEKWLTALDNLVGRNRRRYGGYIVHLGVVLIALGIIGSNFFKTEVDFNLAPGEEAKIQDYTMHFERLTDYQTAGYTAVAGVLSISQNGRSLGSIAPERYLYPGDWPPTTEAAIRSTPIEDLYLVLVGWEEDGSATFRATINPLVMWLWTGWGVLILGTLVATWPDPREAVARVYAPQPLPQKFPLIGGRG